MYDVIIPTLKSREQVAPLVEEIERTAGCPVNVIATCQPVSAARNRNIGLEASTSDPVLMIDDDITGLQDGWVAALVEALSGRRKRMMISARLMAPDGKFGCMMGWDGRGDTPGIHTTPHKRLCIACFAMRRMPIRFDEEFRGSGFEDNDFCAQVMDQYPFAELCIHGDVKVVHLNEKKNQHGANWNHNKNWMLTKWGRL